MTFVLLSPAALARARPKKHTENAGEQMPAPNPWTAPGHRQAFSASKPEISHLQHAHLVQKAAGIGVGIGLGALAKTCTVFGC